MSLEVMGATASRAPFFLALVTSRDTSRRLLLRLIWSAGKKVLFQFSITNDGFHFIVVTEHQ